MIKEPKPWTIVREDYWPVYTQEVGADAVQLELNLEWLANKGEAKSKLNISKRRKLS